MLKEIEPKSLSRYLYLTGPYIYYFKDKNDKFNASIVISMKNMSKTYPKITVLQIDWEKQLSYNSYLHDNDKNTIFLYFKGNLMRKIIEPNVDLIKQFFLEAIEYHKQRLEIYFKNQGSKLVQDKPKTQINADESQMKVLKPDQIKKILYRKRQLAKDWHEVSRIEKTALNKNSEKLQSVIKHQGDELYDNVSTIEKFPTINKPFIKEFVDNYVQINTLPLSVIESKTKNHNTKIYSDHKPISKQDLVKCSENWFTNVENITMIPNEFLEDPNILDHNNKNSINPDLKYIHDDLKSPLKIKKININCNKIQDSHIKVTNFSMMKKIVHKNNLLTKPKTYYSNNIILPEVSNIIPVKSTSMAVKYATELSNLYSKVISIEEKVNPKIREYKIYKRKKYKRISYRQNWNK